MTKPRFLEEHTVNIIQEQFQTPAFVYDLETLQNQADKALAFPNAFGLTVRFAMKACPNAALLAILAEKGLHIDASSGFEVMRAIKAGIASEHISLSTQEAPEDLLFLLNQGISINACSLHQIEEIGKVFPASNIGVRLNPGLGSGGTNKTNVGGPSSSFGIWHEDISQVKELAQKYNLTITRIHTHIGSGSDPEVWQKVSNMSLDLVKEFPNVTHLNLGGGFKVGRMENEVSTDLQAIGTPVKEAFEAFQKETGRELHLEIEPGTFLVANAGSLVTKIQDITSTGENGYTFLKLNSGMTEILRPSLYAAQHPITVFPKEKTGNEKDYVVVGHCCESGDLLTPLADSPDSIGTRKLPEVQIGDLCVIDGAGAYCSAMSTKNYNSFPEAAEILLNEHGDLFMIRQRQTLEQIIENEVPFRG